MSGAGNLSSMTPMGQTLDNPSLASEEQEEFPAVVNLNVGGTHFTTSLSTLTKERNSNLAAMFSGRHVINKDSYGRYFIDCNGGDFEYILNFLRSGQLPLETKAADVYRLAKQFGISSLQNALKYYKPVDIIRRIDEIANGPKSRDYEKIKNSALEKLTKIHTGEDIMLDIYSTGQTRMACYGCWCQKIVRTFATIYLEVNVEVTGELVWCLAEELSMMGYGRYVDSTAGLRLSRCIKHRIVLSRNSECIKMLLSH